MSNLSLTYSVWWVFVCLILGAGYAWIQYSKTSPWSRQLNHILAVLRMVLIASISFFLLEPYVHSITNYFQKPKMIIAIDNSESMVMNMSEEEFTYLKSSIAETEKKISDQGYDVGLVNLEGDLIDNIDSLRFNRSVTDLSKQITKVKTKYSNFNLAGIILFSDGIFNEGYTPTAIAHNFPIYAIGVGDTSKIKDLAVSKVIHNSTVFEGNSMVLEIQMQNTSMGDVSSELVISQRGVVVARKSVDFSSTKLLEKMSVSVPITGSGKSSISILLKPVDGEFTDLNNRKTIYFDVIDAQKKILIVANAPHPDLKAVKSAIEKNENYKVDLAFKLPDELVYDLIIAHQFPSVKTTIVDRKRLLNSNLPKWFIIGGTNDFRFLQNDLQVLTYNRLSTKADLVKPAFNTEFDAFQVSDELLKWVSDLPPLTVSYGLEVDLSLYKVLLKQQIGNVITDKPLLFFSKHSEQRMAVLMGTNSWKWKLEEFRVDQTHQNFEQLISKTVQYLSADTGKKRFYTSPQKETYEKGENILFQTEEYNALFERITGREVALEITNEAGEKTNYSYMPLSTNSTYKITNLSEGVYSYNATAEIDSKKYYTTGQFIIKELNREALNPVADFDLLQKLASKSQASFYSLKDLDEFINQVGKLNPISTIHTSEKEEPLFNLKWILGLLILLATSEWFLRKFYGGY